ncbi:glycosyltransferase family A protein [Nodosilinea sp. E11]|uniref:glycosyltransferase family 2 protein n=1 Tax=Nodosilinea sp. E11 TaxID=3037479 RepID=UPI002934AC70|nr:glycosyltransferase family A protein [Nodosilinea sp. E11]WOD39263.1 glycosyltransferase family A protein [Nodosilinea sp. E11]
MTSSNLSFGVVVCTYNRKSILEQSLAHWQRSNRKPDQFLVIDATANAETYRDTLVESYQSLFSDSSSNYVVTSSPGLTLQRNLGLARIKTDIVCFVDDDAFVTPTYVDKIIDVFEKDANGLIGGVNGVSMGQFDNPKQRYSRVLRNFLRHRFGHLAQRIHVPKSKTQLFKPLSTELKSLPLIPIDRLWGANMNYRKSAIGDQYFDENFKNYGLYEDVDMSVRIGQNHKLVCRIDAELNHDDDLGKTTRPSDVRYFLASWLNSAYIIEKLFPCRESRDSYQRLFRITRELSKKLSTEQRSQKIRTLGNEELFTVVERYVALLQNSSQEGHLETAFTELQDKAFSQLLS